MKTRLKWIVVPAFALGMGACKKEAPPATTDTPPAEQPGVVEKTVEKVKDAVAEVLPSKASASAEERAAKLGFVKHLPKNIESLVTVYGAANTGEKAKSLKLWKLIQDEMGAEALIEEAAGEPAEAAVEAVADAADAAVEAAADAAADQVDQAAAPGEVPAPPAAADVAAAEAAEEEPEADPNAFDPKVLWANEVSVALGAGSGEQLGHLLHLYRRFGYFQTRMMTKAAVSAAKSADSSAFSELNDDYEKLISDVLKDPESGVGSFEKLNFSPLYIACKVDADKRENAAQQISSSLDLAGSFGDFAEPLEVEKAGGKFSGYKIKGSKISEVLAGQRESVGDTIDAETFDRLVAAVAKKDIVILSGAVGDYVVLFIGGSESQFELATDVKDSLAANDGLSFTDGYLSKDVMALVYGEKAALKTLVDNASTLSDTTNGIRDGLAGQDGLGDTREIESLLQIVAEREQALRKLARVDDAGVIAFYEQGLKIESFGGIDQGAIDWKTPVKLNHLGDSPDVVLFANTAIDPVYDKASREFIESIFESAYAITLKVAELPNENPDFVKFKEGTKLFNEKFREDTLGIWEAISGDFVEGLGHEGAWVVDLKGTVPAIPGIPQAVVDQGKFPRISAIAPVRDRAKVASSWDKINQKATSILGKISEISGNEIPMQKPMSSEKNGITTWFFSMPFFNDDFLPSVSVGDKWFVLSSSKNQALDLVSKAEQGGKEGKGLVMKANFVALQAYAREMQKVVDENQDAILAGNAAQYQDNKEKITKMINTLDDFDALTVHSNREGDVVRTSVHFKTR